MAPAAEAPEALARLRRWLADGCHGEMLWMAETPERRALPQRLWPEVSSVILLGASYAGATDPLAALSARNRGSIALYARRRDYHDVLKGRLKELAGFLAAKGGGDVKVFVDTAPVLEKTLAARAGLGWQGKNTMLVSRRHGNWLFLAAIYTSLDLPADAPHPDRCGSCTRCLDICPTGAFPRPYALDARRCISYLTIEFKGTIPLEFRAAIGNRVFGCDDCLAICPWNRFAKAAADQKLALQEAFEAPDLALLAGLDDAAFRAFFAGTPVKRTGRDRFVRNVLIAIGNSDNPGLAPLAAERLGDASALVRSMAVWALSQLAGPAEFERLRRAYQPREVDADVQAEWWRREGG